MPVTEIVPRLMTLEEFTPLVGKDFMLDCTPAPLAVRLIEATPLRENGSGGRAPFILVFRTGPEAKLIDGIYTMQCSTFGPVAIGLGGMVVPLSNEPGYYYQAVFN